jgi:hypothetical protein
VRSAGQQLLGQPSSVARPLRPVNFGPRERPVEQHHESASLAFASFAPAAFVHSRKRSANHSRCA